MPNARTRNNKTLGVSLPDFIADVVQQTAADQGLTVSAYLAALVAADIAEKANGNYRLALHDHEDGYRVWRWPTGAKGETVVNVDRASLEAFLRNKPAAITTATSGRPTDHSS